MKTSALKRFAIASSLVGALMLMLFVSPGAGIVNSHPATNVVPPSGKVAGHGYAYWLQRHWQSMFNLNTSSPSAANSCKSLTVNGQRVAYLSGPHSTSTCSEPAGRPIYVPVASADCSTFSGDHEGFGTSDSQLELCSKSMFARVGTALAFVDGRAVDIKGLVAATGAFPVHAASGNPFGLPAGSGRLAAYGSALLLTGFSQGTHTIHYVVSGSSGANVTYSVHIS
jgi:hypothetical protein